MRHADMRLEPGSNCREHAASCDRVKRACKLQRLVRSSNGMPKPAHLLLRVLQRELAPRAPLAGFAAPVQERPSPPRREEQKGGMVVMLER